MKKILLTTVIASVALASCVNNEVTNPQDGVKQKISFDSPVLYSNENSRANAFGEIELYPTDEQFIIYAVSHTKDFPGWESTDVVTADFNGTAIAYDGGTTGVGGWAPKTAEGGYYYWENGVKMSFAACSPADLDIDGCVRTYGAEGLTITDFEVAAKPAEQYDLLFSTRVCNQTSGNMTGAGSYNGIPIKFQHALSSIRFAIANDSEETVVLTGIKVVDVNYKGDFAENIIENATDKTMYARTVNVDPEWTVVTTATADYTAFSGSLAFTDERALVSGANPLLLMPQELSDDAALEINYTVNGKANTKTVYLKGLESVSDSQVKTAINSWEMGKRYTYRLIYNQETAAKDKIYFAPSAEQWVDVDDIIVNL